MCARLLTASVAIGLLATCNKTDGAPQERSQPSSSRQGGAAVQGPSLLSRLRVSVEKTRLGKAGGHASPPASTRSEPMPPAGGETFSVTGADLYRFGCQACHGPDGSGSPPEVASLLGAVQATSAAALQTRMADAGREISPEMARQLAADARKTLEARLQNGGEKMPAFDYLNAREKVALLAYLPRLAAVAQAPKAVALEEPPTRVGELIARGTCHICHDGTGPGNPHRTMMSGEIPSLESLPRNWSLGAVVEKVRTGQGTMMGPGRMGGRGGMMGRGRGMMGGPTRMPAYPYFSRQEIAAVYQFLGGSPSR